MNSGRKLICEHKENLTFVGVLAGLKIQILNIGANFRQISKVSKLYYVKGIISIVCALK
jgi:hypothetical protein